jgi:hypothetical protein
MATHCESAIFYVAEPDDTRIDTPKIIPLHLGIEPGTSETISTGFVVREIEVYVRHLQRQPFLFRMTHYGKPSLSRGDLKQQNLLVFRTFSKLH